MPRCRASSSRSTRVTGMPASRSAAAMPAPIVPPPITAAERTGRGSTPLRAGGRGAARSAKKTWRRAAASGEARRSRKVSRSKAIAASKSASVARRTQASARSGAAAPRAAFRTAFSASCQKPGSAVWGGRSRSGAGKGRASAAKATAAARRSPSSTASIRPISSAFGAFTGLPLVTISTAAAGGHEPRQPDGAAGTGHDAEGDLGQADRGGGRGHAEAAGERHLEAAAEGGAVDGGDPGLSRALDPGNDVRQVRRHRRLAELGHVGAGDEGAPGADQHHRVDGLVGIEGLHRVRRAPGGAPARGRSPAGCRRSRRRRGPRGRC